ncbi:MAG TPA: metalloregulator ArsR/SmtB family transcription factor [Candidatus Moranbacteria bacterium]|jgi:ArsR family transcriptional regulator|nr:winged helix-turn-helix transcriptional regulator [Candidatus Moranbacteria bacterium]HOF42557.1 metalloregulator ArsR/SmtB family transcription factor [Candidatus Moranbacteria bacterium]HPX94764.1 metalloregulator ArsR/SmtB family transcription factor [Candidatus Moranbacteria bacterium]HQB59606.1 metalloregulator ArsR/SmtB family transcription factor [Candidatus Moranbacteria bacterium]
MSFNCCGKNSKEADDVAKTYSFLRAIADPNRLKILCVLQRGSKCVCEIIPAIGISDKLASHHLKQLKKIGLLNETREGNFIRYSLNKKAIKDYKKIFNQVIK